LDTLRAHNVTRGSGSLLDTRIAVVGAGMVGVCTALELQARGAQVTLIDRRAPGQETSFGNAGVLARSSLVPINNPGLFANLPQLMRNRSAALRYDPRFILRNTAWAFQFLNQARGAPCKETATALDGLIRLSIARHLDLIAQCGLGAHLSDRGWMFLYRSEGAFQRSQRSRAMMLAHDVDAVTLDRAEVSELEPCLSDLFPKALWIRDSYSVNNPGAVVAGYAQAFAASGGEIVQADVARLSPDEPGGVVHLDGGRQLSADHMVLCLGPWGRQFLEQQGYSVTMAYERGYHRHFKGPSGASANRPLSRPVCDTGGSYVLAPMEWGLRLSTGVELCDRDAPPNDRQLRTAERAARQAVDLGDAVDEAPWLGSRPTFPDSRPVIGTVPGTPNLSVAFGHQHIGFMTGPGTASLLADLIEGVTPQIDPAPFRPERFVRRRKI
jgi:D-amino-acid dehydrogenase